MRVLIVGAGAVGSVLAGLLSKKKEISVDCATNDLKAAEQFFRYTKRKFRLLKTDASRTGSIVRVARGADVIVNTSLPAFNLKIMRAALVVGANYVDLDSRLEDWQHAEQLRFDGRFKRAGLTGLINAGVSPGLTNLLAADAADRLSSVASLKFRILEEQQADRAIPTWSPRVVEDELTAWPLIYRRGKFGFTRPFKDASSFRFPAPYGRRRVVSIYGDEVATVPLYLRVRDVDYKAGGGDIEMALGGGEQNAYAQVPSPIEMRELVRDGVIRHARLIVSVEAAGRAGGRARRITSHAVFPEIKEIMRRAPGATYIGYPTALCVSAFVSALPTVGRRGAFPPEALAMEARRKVFAELKDSGVIIKK